MRFEENKAHDVVTCRESRDQLLFVLLDSAFKIVRNAGVENAVCAGEDVDVIDGRGQIVPVRYLIRTDKN